MSYGNSGYPNNPSDPNQGWAAAQDPNQAWAGDQGAQPTSQSSAGYAQSQPSGDYPASHYGGDYGQPSGGDYAGGQYGGEFAGSQPSAPSYPGDYQQQTSAGGYGGQPGGGGGSYPTRPAGSSSNEDSFFKALFDFGFTRYATPSVVKILYLLGIAMGVLLWFFSGLSMIIGGAIAASNPYTSGGSGGGALLGVLAWVIGLIPLFFWIVGLRVSLEYALAMVRLNQDSKAIRTKLDA
ncbi:MAG: DUF4282 domain-containing protein [Propionibacteriaceae bacterium]|nr:DUF4282 domain-containing protein [Propionibacteriaceae bacterium]